MKREGALQSQARAEIELRGNCSVRSLGDSKLETGTGTLDLGCWRYEIWRLEMGNGEVGKRTLALSDLGWVIDLSQNIMSVS